MRVERDEMRRSRLLKRSAILDSRDVSCGEGVLEMSVVVPNWEKVWKRDSVFGRY
jgi:hypothetical protein